MRHTLYNADIRIPRGINNTVAIELLIAHIRQLLQRKSNQHLEYLLSLEKSVQEADVNKDEDSEIAVKKEGASELVKTTSRPSNLQITKQTNQVRAIHTIILNTSQTSRDDFVFYFNRIAEILLNDALAQLDEGFYETVPDLYTPQGTLITDAMRPTGTVAAVAMIRGGGCFEKALRRVLGSDGRASYVYGGAGKVLIQSDSRTGEPQLHSLTLPPCISPRPTQEGTLNKADCLVQASTRVLLLDSQLTSGAAITMAAAILIDHGIREENIIVVAYIASDMAVNRILNAFPKLKIVAGHVETKLYPRFIDSMYYGT